MHCPEPLLTIDKAHELQQLTFNSIIECRCTNTVNSCSYTLRRIFFPSCQALQFFPSCRMALLWKSKKAIAIDCPDRRPVRAGAHWLYLKHTWRHLLTPSPQINAAKCHQKDLKREWDSTWKKELKSSHLYRITNKLQAKPSSALYNNVISRRPSVHLARLRTGHCFLNHRFSVEDSPLCPSGNGAGETVEH